MQENLTSSEALRDGTGVAVPVRQATDAEFEMKTASFGDTLTLQAILCVLMALAFIVLNMTNGGLAANIFDLYESKFGEDSTIAEVFAAVVDFLGTAPIDNV